MDGTLIFVPQTQIQVQPARYLPGVLRKEVETVHGHFALLVALQDDRLIHVTRHEVGQSGYVGIVVGVIQQRAPGPLRAVEKERSATAGGIERVHMRLPDLAAETHGVRAAGPGESIRKVTGDVITAGIGTQPGGVHAADRNERRAGYRDTGIQSKSHWVNAGVAVGENLVEITDTEQDLVGDRGRNDAVVDQRVVLHVHGAYLVIVGDMRTDGCDLHALPHIPLERQPVAVVEAVVDLGQTIMAETDLRNR